MIRPDLLRSSVPALAALSDGALQRLAYAAVERRYAAGATLFREGDRADALYLVLSGRVRVLRATSDGVCVLHHEGPGGVLGEIPVFGARPYPATAVATVATRCARVHGAALVRLSGEDPELARFAMRRLADRAAALLGRIDELTGQTIATRVAAIVLARARAAQGGDFTLGMSQDALAEELGTAREVVVRAIAGLCAAGAVERAGRARYRVPNESLLVALTASSRSAAVDR